MRGTPLWTPSLPYALLLWNAIFCTLAGVFAHMNLPWADLPSFLAVARDGSLSAAAKTLLVDRTTIARRLDNLERMIKEPLFDRMDGKFVLTSFGRRVFAAAEEAERGLSFLGKSGLENIHQGGRVRVSLSEHLLLTLTDCFKGFASEHADILLELTATDRAADLNHFEADVVLRISRESLGGLFAKKIGKPFFSLYKPRGNTGAETLYIARPSETDVPKYLKSFIPNARMNIAVDGLVSMRELIANGTGAGILPNYFGDQDPRIERCSPPLPSLGFSLYLACLPEQRNLRRIKTFMGFVEDYLQPMSGFDE